jgi:hypothetical protein
VLFRSPPSSLGRERAERRISEEQREQRLKLDRATVERDSLRERLKSIRLSKRGEQPKGGGEPDAG